MKKVALVMALWSGLAAAQAPATLSYQGRLSHPDGRPRTGVVQVTFKIFAEPSGGMALFETGQSLALNANGFYSTFLDVPNGLFDGSDRYLELAVDAQALSPRQKMASVPYALSAQTAKNVKGGSADVTGLSVGGVPVLDAQGRLVGPALSAMTPPGTIVMYGGAVVPQGWLLCDGTLKNSSEFPALSQALGVAYGGNAGAGTFNLPDLRVRFPVGKGPVVAVDTLGKTGGDWNHQHVVGAHDHAVNPPLGTSDTGSNYSPNGCSGPGSLKCGQHDHAVTTPPFRTGNAPAETTSAANPPFVVVNFIIKT